MTAMNPLFDKKIIKAGDVSMRLVLMEGKDAYLVEILFPLDGLRVYASRWANPLRCALEAAEEALNVLKCEIFNAELNGDKPYKKQDPADDHEAHLEAQERLAQLVKEKKDG